VSTCHPVLFSRKNKFEILIVRVFVCVRACLCVLNVDVYMEFVTDLYVAFVAVVYMNSFCLCACMSLCVICGCIRGVRD